MTRTPFTGGLVYDGTTGRPIQCDVLGSKLEEAELMTTTGLSAIAALYATTGSAAELLDVAGDRVRAAYLEGVEVMGSSLGGRATTASAASSSERRRTNRRDD